MHPSAAIFRGANLLPSRPATAPEKRPCTGGALLGKGFLLQPCRSPASQVAARVTLRIKDYQGAGDFDLSEECDTALRSMLHSEALCAQVAREGQLGAGAAVEFTGFLFQPLPWSPSTPKGMPQEFEQFHGHEDYVFINVPPTAMFKAKVFKPSRLCAIYKRKA